MLNPLTARLSVDPREYDFGDAASTVRTTPRRWRWITEDLHDVPAAALLALDSIFDVLGAAGGTGTGLEELVDPVWRRLDRLAGIHGPRTKIVEVLGAHDALVVATEECDLMLSAAARSVTAGVAPRGQGMLEAIHVSNGGAPKGAVPAVEIGSRGPVGDRQADRAHHGRPYQAVSLYSLELVEALAAEGHPITPGSVGENLLLSGIDWRSVRPGVRLVISPRGDRSESGQDPDVDSSAGEDRAAVVLELNAWAPPCRTIAGSFTDRRFERIDPDRFPGWARAYAWVLAGGTVTCGDEVALLG